MTTRSLRSCGKIFVLLVSKTPPDANEGCRLLDYADRAIQTLGHPQPAFDVIVGLLAASVTFTAHSVKTGTRLMVNQSPEPFSNVAVSLGENIMVGGLFALLWSHPLIAIIILLLFFSLAFYFLPKICRAIGVRVWFIRLKLKQPALSHTETVLPTKLPGRYQHALNRLSNPPQQIAWTG